MGGAQRTLIVRVAIAITTEVAAEVRGPLDVAVRGVEFHAG